MSDSLAFYTWFHRAVLTLFGEGAAEAQNCRRHTTACYRAGRQGYLQPI